MKTTPERMSSKTKKIDPLSKKVPVNPKYKDVKSTIDTGKSQTKYLEKLEEIKKHYKFRKDEIFKRMKVATFVQLIVQVAEFDSFLNDIPTDCGDMMTDRPSTTDIEVEQIQNNTYLPTDSTNTHTDTPSTVPSTASTVPDSSRSRLEQVITGVGEIDVDPPKSTSRLLPLGDKKPYLILDVRERDAFDTCHLISAKSYPTAMLARSVNYESKEMLNYKNQEGKIIVLYDEDESLTPRAATTLVQRGYDNLFMLSGGLRVAYKYFPDGLISGTPPTTVTEKKAPKEIVPATDAELSQSDIDNLSLYLENPLDNESKYSRLHSGRSSKASSMSSRMSTSSISTSRSINSVRSEASIHAKPFK